MWNTIFILTAFYIVGLACCLWWVCHLLSITNPSSFLCWKWDYYNFYLFTYSLHEDEKINYCALELCVIPESLISLHLLQLTVPLSKLHFFILSMGIQRLLGYCILLTQDALVSHGFLVRRGELCLLSDAGLSSVWLLFTVPRWRLVMATF